MVQGLGQSVGWASLEGHRSAGVESARGSCFTRSLLAIPIGVGTWMCLVGLDGFVPPPVHLRKTWRGHIALAVPRCCGAKRWGLYMCFVGSQQPFCKILLSVHDKTLLRFHVPFGFPRFSRRCFCFRFPFAINHSVWLLLLLGALLGFHFHSDYYFLFAS